MLAILASLRCLAEAAERLICLDSLVKAEALQLLNFGRRRANRFLGASMESLIPFFGLGTVILLTGLSEPNEEESGLAYLRELAKQYGLGPSDALIRHRHTVEAHGQTVHLQDLFSAVPHQYVSKNRNGGGHQLEYVLHARWLHVERDCSLTPAVNDFLDRMQHGKEKYIEERGEQVTMILEPPVEKHGHWMWPEPPSLYDAEEYKKHVTSKLTRIRPLHWSSDMSSNTVCWCFVCPIATRAKINNPIWFWRWTTIGRFELLINREAKYMTSSMDSCAERFPDIHPSESTKKLASRVRPSVLCRYLQWSLSTCSEDNGRLRLDESWGQKGSQNINYIKEVAEVQSFSNCEKRLLALRALALANEVYSQLDGARISTKVVQSPLNDALWLESSGCNCLTTGKPCRIGLSLPLLNNLSCIVHFESGNLNFEPAFFKETLAIASGNSIFVARRLLSDPIDVAAEHNVRRITGNIGRPGISFLMAPVEPKIKAMGDQYDIVNHYPYDGKREDNFASTSLHLSFTKWAIPIEARGTRTGLIDQDAYFVESIVSVFDVGKWIADLDVFSIPFDELTYLTCNDVCPGHSDRLPEYDHTSIDNWEELLDNPREVGYFRSHGKWAARLAAVSIICQQG